MLKTLFTLLVLVLSTTFVSAAQTYHIADEYEPSKITTVKRDVMIIKAVLERKMFDSKHGDVTAKEMEYYLRLSKARLIGLLSEARAADEHPLMGYRKDAVVSEIFALLKAIDKYQEEVRYNKDSTLFNRAYMKSEMKEDHSLANFMQYVHWKRDVVFS